MNGETRAYEPTILEATAAVGCRSVRQWNILRDVELAGHVDIGRLRDALAEAAQRHPLSRAKRVVKGDGTWAWQVESGIASGALQVADTAAGDLNPLLRELRAERLSAAQAPALRCIAVRGPASDRLLFNFCHERTDGIGAMAFLATLQAAYAGELHRLGAADSMVLRHGGGAAASRGFETPGLVQPNPIEHLVGDSGEAFDDTSHVVNFELPVTQLRSLKNGAAGGVTVTHHVVAAMLMACARWNGARGRGLGRMCIGIPVNARPGASSRTGFFNAYGTMCINAQADEVLTLAQAARSVAAQSDYLKPIAMENGAAWGFSTATATAPTGPALTLPDHLIPTATVSSLGAWNLGQFGKAGQIMNVWAPPLPMNPMAVALGVVGLGGKVCLSFRFAASMIGRNAGRDFAAMVLGVLRDGSGEVHWGAAA